MTINIAVVTSEAIVFGCDSVSSSTQVMLDPFGRLDVTPDGNLFTDEQGNWVARFKPSHLAHITTHARSGVTKMFRLCGDHNPVAGVTAGLAALNGKNIAECVDDYRRQHNGHEHQTVAQVVEEFSAYMGRIYDDHFVRDPTPPAFRHDVEFLVGGYGAEDRFPSLYRINLQRQGIRHQLLYGTGEGISNTGVAWAGQSDAVERLIFGFDVQVQTSIQEQINAYLDRMHLQMSQAMVTILERVLAALGHVLPDGIDTTIPVPERLQPSWQGHQLEIDIANLPLQDAVEFASFLVNLQSGKSIFARGVPTVGGRTHIGVVRHNSFTQLNEPSLQHRNVGYDRSL